MMAHVWTSWRSWRWRELGLLLLFVLFLGVEDLGPLVDFGDESRPLVFILLHWMQLLFLALVFFLFWLPADRSAPDHPLRLLRLIGASLLGAGMGALLLQGLMLLMPWPDMLQAQCEPCAISLMLAPSWRQMLGMALLSWVTGGLMAALLEMLARRSRQQAALRQIQDEQGRLAQAAVASRLATLQAQLDPQFLFEALVCLERGYASDEPTQVTLASHQMTCLIDYLRQALPRLRERGSLLSQEFELLRSYIALQDALQQRHTSFVQEGPAEAVALRVPAGRLLPLLQGMLADCAGTAATPRLVKLTLRPAIDVQSLQLSLALSQGPGQPDVTRQLELPVLT
ncbi:histidine kinase [Paucibacter sp. AS339]|uniref:histidine kinase n=1 Tax=Paucibacter hankyongi TaxID=3133434 RepID=UPI0030A38D41